MVIKAIQEICNEIPLPAKAGFAFLVCSVLQSGLNIITLPLFTRILTTEQYGLSSNYFAWNEMFAILCTFRFSYGVFDKGMVVYKDEKDSFQSALLGLSMTITCVVACLFIIFFDLIESYLDMPLWLCLTMLVYQLVSPALLFWTNRSKFDYNYKKYSVVTLTTALLCTVVNLLSVIYIPGDRGIVKIVSYQLIWIIVNTVITIGIFKKGKIFYRGDVWKYALSYNVPLLPYFLSTVILDKSDRIMITNICGRGDVALYSVSYNLANLMILFTSAIGGTFTPWIYRKLANKDYKDVPKISNMIIILFMGLSCIFMLFAPEFIKIFASEEYREAIYVIPPVVASNYFILIYSLVSKVEYYFEKTKIVALISVVTALINIILNYIFIGRCGYIAAAYTTLFSYIISSILHCIASYYIKKKKNIVDCLFSWKIIIILSLVMLFITILVNVFYEYVFIRWFIIFVLITVSLFNKTKIIKLFSMIKGWNT